jgi:ppGpp synthetase/RelA/SpoT-type nucleotidyltranferase
MKIPGSIRELYVEQEERSQRLKGLVDPLILGRLHGRRWHYESRIKGAESYTLKIETGRCIDLMALHDFFATTIVVRNSLEIPDAEEMIRELFDYQDRNPIVDTETDKAPDAFPFDDIRLYVGWKDGPGQPPTGLAGTVFEVQIKTFLQHAWSIATHDLTYKTDDVSWGKMRIAYQIKAMLEHAEISIQQATILSESAALNKSDSRTASVKEFMTLAVDLWPKEDLPGNVRRLAENLMGLAKLVRLNAGALRALLLEEQEQGRGPAIRNLSPYGVVVQTLLDRKKGEFAAGLKRQSELDAKRRRPVVLTRELELPPEVQTELWKKATILVE